MEEEIKKTVHESIVIYFKDYVFRDEVNAISEAIQAQYNNIYKVVVRKSSLPYKYIIGDDKAYNIWKQRRHNSRKIKEKPPKLYKYVGKVPRIVKDFIKNIKAGAIMEIHYLEITQVVLYYETDTRSKKIYCTESLANYLIENKIVDFISKNNYYGIYRFNDTLVDNYKKYFNWYTSQKISEIMKRNHELGVYDEYMKKKRKESYDRIMAMKQKREEKRIARELKKKQKENPSE